MHSQTAVANAKKHNYPVIEQGDDNIIVEAPGGYKFTLVDKDVTGGKIIYNYPLHALHAYDAR